MRGGWPVGASVVFRSASARIVEAATHELDEHVLERGLGLAERDGCGAQAAERADDAAERGVLREHEVDARWSGGRRSVGLGRGRAADTTPGQRGEARRAAVEPVELEPEDRLALDAPLELGGRADGEDPAAVDDGDPLAQLVGLGHVVRRQQDRPTGDRGAASR